MYKGEESAFVWCVGAALLNTSSECIGIIEEKFIVWEEILNVFGRFIGCEFGFLDCYYRW